MTAFSQHHCRAGRPDDRETFACLPSSLWGHSGQMTAEAFGRLASWSSFNIVVGRHDEFAHSRVAIPQKRGTTAKSIVLHFPPSHTLKLETPERRHSCHTRHSHYPRGRGMPRKNRQNTRSVPHPLAQIHAQCTAPPIDHYDTFPSTIEHKSFTKSITTRHRNRTACNIKHTPQQQVVQILPLHQSISDIMVTAGSATTLQETWQLHETRIRHRAKQAPSPR